MRAQGPVSPDVTTVINALVKPTLGTVGQAQTAWTIVSPPALVDLLTIVSPPALVDLLTTTADDGTPLATAVRFALPRTRQYRWYRQYR